MPTVLRFAGWRVVIYPNDHRPAHVHVIGNDCEAVFELNCRDGRITLRENYGCGALDITRARRALEKNQKSLCREWERIHGTE